MRFSVLAMPLASALASAPTLPPGEAAGALAEVPMAFVFAHAPWCGHCVQAKPAFEEVEAKVPTYLVDCSTPEAAPFRNAYGVKGFPTFLFLEYGKLTDTYNGARTRIAIESYLEQKAAVAAPAEEEPETPAPAQEEDASETRASEDAETVDSIHEEL
jgi:thiol-disulfide isomerase/thioredoxin